jgi:hypothetical protein
MGEMQSSAPAAPAPATEVTATIHPLPTFAAEGVVTITRDGTQFIVVVAAESHLPQADYPTHIHEGRCADGGRVVASLVPIEGQEAGEGRSTTRIEASALTATGNYFVQIHAPNGTPVGCGDLPLVNL